MSHFENRIRKLRHSLDGLFYRPPVDRQSVFAIGVMLVVIAAQSLCFNETCHGQRPRFPDFFAAETPPSGVQLPTVTGQPPALFQPPSFLQGQPGVIQGPIIQSPPQGAVIGEPILQLPGVFNSPPIITTTPPPSRVVAPPFDPFRSSGQSYPIAPGRPATTYQILPPTVTAPAPQPSGFQVLPPQTNLQPVAPRGGFFPNAPQPYFDPNINAPRPVYRGPQFQPLGLGGYQGPGFNPQAARWPSINWAWPSQAWARLRADVFPRLFERPRVRHTWLQGNNGNELDINTLELATTMTLPIIGRMRQPIRMTPGFTFDWWNGPETPATGFDLPSKAYSAFLAFDHVTDPNQVGGLESNFTIGVYSDFDNTEDSIRLTGLLLGWYRLNEINTIKYGVEYLDRVKVKLLPAFGVFIAPTPDLKLDVYFPRPRIAQRIPNVSDFEVWSYVGAEYGGGSWSIERPVTGIDDRVDINDIRAFVGLEWLGPRGRTGFLEGGYAFQRELVFESSIPARELELQDTFMIRLGFAL